MCKYCKRLQELRKEDQRTLGRWKRYVQRLENKVLALYYAMDGVKLTDVQGSMLDELKIIVEKDTIR